MSSKRIAIGLFLILIGIVLLLNQLNLIPSFIPDYVLSWPSILIIIGVIQLLVKRDKTPGLIIGGVGIIFLIQQMNPSFNPINYWPLFLILAGLGIMLKKKRKEEEPHPHKSERVNKNEIDEVAVFSGGERVITSDQFSGGSVTTIFGGSEINLLHSSLAPGVNTIEVFSIFGGATFFVPSDWKVKVEVVAIFGGFSDKRRVAPSGGTTTEKELVIKGFVIFGGGEIKSI